MALGSYEDPYDVVVIGGGLTGLVAAYELQKQGNKVVVLEARDAVGGRVRTESRKFQTDLGDVDSHFDLGARFIGKHPSQMMLFDLVHELGLGEDVKEQYEGVFKPGSDPYWAELAAHLLHDPVAGTLPYIGPLIPFDASSRYYLKYLRSLINDFPLHDPTRMPNAAELDKLSVQEWADTINLPGHGKPTDEFRGLLHMLCRVGFSEEPENISMLWFLFYIASSGGIERFQSVRWPVEGSQGYRLKRGAQSIAEALRERLDGVAKDTVRLRAKVTTIDDTEDEKVAVTIEEHKQKVHGKRALVALSPALYGKSSDLKFVPDLPASRRAAAAAMAMPKMILSYVTFSKAFWRTSKDRYTRGFVNGEGFDDISRFGLSGDVLFTQGPVVWVMDATSNAQEPALFAFIVGKAARDHGGSTKTDHRKAIVLDEMRRIFGDDVDRYDPKYFEMNWSDDALALGGPAAHFAKGAVFEHCRNLMLAGDSKPHKDVYFASTETAMISNGYMAGAVWSGAEVAADIAVALDASTSAVVSSFARERAMRWCIRTILRAIEEQDPTLEFPALHDEVEFYGPGAEALPYGPYVGKLQTFDFYRLLAQRVSITNVHIESWSADPDTNMGFAQFTVDGVVLTNMNPFRDLKASMVFEFDPSQDEVLVRKDWLLIDPITIDAMLAAPRGPFAELPATAELAEAKDEMMARARAIAQFDAQRAGDDPFVIRAPAEMTLRRGLIGAEGLALLADGWSYRHEMHQVSEKLELDSMTYYAWYEGGSGTPQGPRRLLVTVSFKCAAEPYVSEATFQLSIERKPPEPAEATASS